LYALGYTDTQLDIIFDRILQLYTAKDCKGNLHVAPSAATLDIAKITVYDNVTRKSKELYLKKWAGGPNPDARPQSGFISQHFAPGGPGDASEAGIASPDVNQSFTWQHDPYNGKVTSVHTPSSRPSRLTDPLSPPARLGLSPALTRPIRACLPALPGQGLRLQRDVAGPDRRSRSQRLWPLAPARHLDREPQRGDEGAAATLLVL